MTDGLLKLLCNGRSPECCADLRQLAGGLASTAVVNVAFGLGSAYWWFCGLWALNGILQVPPLCC